MSMKVVPPLIAAMGLVAVATYLVSKRAKGQAKAAPGEPTPKPEAMGEDEVAKLAIKEELKEERRKYLSELGKKGVEARRAKKAAKLAEAAKNQGTPLLQQ